MIITIGEMFLASYPDKQCLFFSANMLIGEKMKKIVFLILMLFFLNIACAKKEGIRSLEETPPVKEGINLEEHFRKLNKKHCNINTIYNGIKFDEEEALETIIHPERVIEREFIKAYNSLEDSLYQDVNVDSLTFNELYNLANISFRKGVDDFYLGVARLNYLARKSNLISDFRLFYSDVKPADIGFIYRDKDGCEWVAFIAYENKPYYILDESLKQRILEKKVFIDEDIFREDKD